MKLRRFDPIEHLPGVGWTWALSSMRECEDGDWVRIGEVKQLIRELSEAKARISELEKTQNKTPMKRNPSVVFERGTRGTYGGFPATIMQHYDGNMYEIRLPGGVVCVDVKDFIPSK
jgi:hypothetical protein